jgi:hypothetical protein
MHGKSRTTASTGTAIASYVHSGIDGLPFGLTQIGGGKGIFLRVEDG